MNLKGWWLPATLAGVVGATPVAIGQQVRLSCRGLSRSHKV